MFTHENTAGFSTADLRLLNRALATLIERGIDESNAADIVTNNWQPAGNSVDSLTRVTSDADPGL
ncbi:MAG: hypothetical protein AB7F22_25575 [Reyranella sp.]|uniref:hypothetical protein n=1 Tax=Reyranella sp. TaxID=1929291 RepID=UPI003D152375